MTFEPIKKERESWLQAWKVLLALNLIVAVLTWRYPSLYEVLPLSMAVFQRGDYWQFFTYMFVHAPFEGWFGFHLLMNMFVLWNFGPVVEGFLGAWRSVLLFICAGLAGAGAFILEQIISAEWRGITWVDPDTLIVGASASLFGWLAFLAWVRPRLKVMIFPLPIPMGLAWLMVLVTLFTVAMLFMPGKSEIGHAAHLGGAISGCIAGWIERRRLMARQQAVYSLIPRE